MNQLHNYEKFNILFEKTKEIHWRKNILNYTWRNIHWFKLASWSSQDYFYWTFMIFIMLLRSRMQQNVNFRYGTIHTLKLWFISISTHSYVCTYIIYIYIYKTNKQNESDTLRHFNLNIKIFNTRMEQNIVITSILKYI